MLTLRDLRRAVLIGLWFMFLTFPIMVIKVNTIEHTIIWRWANMFWMEASALRSL